MMPGNYALTIYRGDDTAWRFVLWADDAKTEPVDLTGIAVKAEVRDRSAGSVIIAAEITVTLPQTIDMVLDHDATRDLPANGRWDLQLTDETGLVVTILAGSVRVTGDITDSGTLTADAVEPEELAALPPARTGGYLLESPP
jgi:hypothetical protein